MLQSQGTDLISIPFEQERNPRPEERAGNRLGSGFRSALRDTARFEGPGIHKGGLSRLAIHPAEIGTGLIFESTNPALGRIPVSPRTVSSTNQAVSLTNGRWEIHTVEHVLAALSVAGITDAVLSLDGSEVPILDGSATEFYQGILAAGIERSDVPVEPIRLNSPVWVVQNDKYLIAVPADEFQVTYTVDFPHPDLSGKTYSSRLNSQIMETEILEARTFGFLKEIEALRSRGLAQGGSLDNAVVLTETGYVNEELRFPDECLRHKVLDLVGDMYLLGRPLQAHLIAFRAGHGLDVALTRNILNTLVGDELNERRKAR